MHRLRTKTVRLLVASALIVLAALSYLFHWGVGVPSAFGIDNFFLLCPLGGLEELLSSHLLIPAAFISLAVVLVFSLVLGRSFCGWACPTQVVRWIAGGKESKSDHAACSASLVKTMTNDTRIWALAIVLIVALIVGFPVFCLVCPIGLTFGTVMSIIQLVISAEPSWGLLVFPVALTVELVLMKKWCFAVCPIAGLLSLTGRFAKAFRPQINASTCLLANGEPCRTCLNACPEHIDLHAQDAQAQLADCTRCAECKAVCPTKSITMPLLPSACVDGRRKTVPRKAEDTID